MPQNTRNKSKKEGGKAGYDTAIYIRLSREDGDRAESLSVANQRLLLAEFLERQNDLSLYDTYIDDGYTGTDFTRPGFQRMLRDIEERKVQCVVVKDLSRLGRNMPKVSWYINEYFPQKRVRFIAVDDSVDRRYDDIDIGNDMMVDIRNLFNGFYPKDISRKVRSTLRSKQENGQFIGAFACFGYQKSEGDHNRLEVDEYAAGIVRRIYELYLGGIGQNTIAKILNEEEIPCPSEYKKKCGLNYQNGNRLAATSYWTYSTVRRILQNETYVGNMVQNRTFRQICGKNAVSLPREKWIVVENTHEPIIDREDWDRVQKLLGSNMRQTGFLDPMHVFAGLLRCADCGRAMVKIRRKGATIFNCGSYNRYGRRFCSIHSVTERELECIVLDDLNQLLQSTGNLGQIIEEERIKWEGKSAALPEDAARCRAEIDRLNRKKEQAYEDYSDHILTKEEYVKYRERYENRICELHSKIEMTGQTTKEERTQKNIWIDQILRQERLEHLDRETAVEMLSMIYIHEDGTIEIVYNFSAPDATCRLRI